MSEPVTTSAVGLDLSSRFKSSTTVVASPQLAAETIIASLTTDGRPTTVSGFRVEGFAAFTVGTSGVSVQFKIRRTNVSGTTVVDTGAITQTAANLGSVFVQGFDVGGVTPGGLYVLTMQVASGGAASTVSAVCLSAVAI